MAGTGVFGKQTPGPGHCGPLTLRWLAPSRYTGRPFSRSYGANLPSSLTEVLSSTLVYSTSPPVSVCGTGTHALTRGFSRRYGLNPCGLRLRAHLPITSQPWYQGICLPVRPTSLEGVTTPEPSPPRPPIAQTVVGGTGILTGCPSPTALALGLGPPHPQLISMAAEPSGIRCGGFTPPSRYSCRHSHSPPLHQAFQPSFSATGTLPYHGACAPSAASVTDLSPGGLSAPQHIDQ